MKKTRIAVAFNNGIGNWIMFTPALRLMAAHFDEVDVFFDEEWIGEGRKAVELMAKNCPFIHGVIEYNDPDQLSGYDKRFASRHSRADRVFQLINRDSFFNFELLPSWANSFPHEIQWYIWEVMNQLDLPGAIPAQYMPMGKLPKGLAKNYVVVSNGYLRSLDRLYEKKAWPHWKEFLETFLNFYPELKVVVLGGKEDQEWGKAISETYDRCLNWAGKTNILESAAIVKKSKAVISNDSCIAHIADALRVPGVVLWGSTLLSKSGPWNGTLLNVTSPLECAPCQGCPKFHVCTGGGCMEAIESHVVMAGCRRIYDKKRR